MTIRPENERSVSYQRFPAPQPGFVEQVYAHHLVADDTGQVSAAVVNERLGLGVQVAWSQAEFPYFFEWLHLREGAYAVGLEPSTHDVGGSLAARADGSMIWLQAGESRTYRTTFTVLDSLAAISEVVRAIQAQQPQPAADVPD